MKTRDVLSYSFSAIKLRKLRAGLTSLGVVIGIAAIVALLSITQGLSVTITGQIQKGLATNTLIVTPGSGGALGGGGGGGGFGDGGFGGGLGGQSSSGFSLYVDNATDIGNLSPGNIVSALALIQRTGYIQNGDTIREVTITGVNFSQYQSLYSTTFVAASGNINSNPSNNEVVIGTRVSDPRQNGTIFTGVGDEDKIFWMNATTLPPINETYNAQVSAVLQKIGGFGIGGPSDQGVYIPISQAESFFGTSQADMIIVQLKNSDNATVSNAQSDIKNAFSDQVSIISGTAVLDLLQSIFGIVNLFLGGIAAISLLVAGIGIMNIMIVSLIERTREIGILKALGMKSRTVLSIFLGESMIIGLIGAVIGIALGWGLANIVAIVFSGGGPFQGVGGNQAATSTQATGMTITPVLTPEVLILAFAFGIGVSVIFALYPAWRASRLKPVDALRYE